MNRSNASAEKRQQMLIKASRALALKRSGYSNIAIAGVLGVSESSVRSLLKIDGPEKV